MRQYRVSVAALMSAILVIALGFAALHAGTIGWSHAIAGLVAMTLTGATSGALFTQGKTRAFCGGMALFGWQCIGAHLYPVYFGFTSYDPDPGYSLAGEIAKAFHPYHESPNRPDTEPGFLDHQRQVWLIDLGAKKAVTEEIARALLNLIYAVLGGLITLGLVTFSGRRSPKRETGVPSEPSATP